MEILPNLHYSLVSCMGRWKKIFLKTWFLETSENPEVVGSSSYQKNIGAELTHNRHDLG